MFLLVNLANHQAVMGDVISCLVKTFGVPCSIAETIEKICPRCVLDVEHQRHSSLPSPALPSVAPHIQSAVPTVAPSTSTEKASTSTPAITLALSASSSSSSSCDKNPADDVLKPRSEDLMASDRPCSSNDIQHMLKLPKIEMQTEPEYIVVNNGTGAQLNKQNTNQIEVDQTPVLRSILAMCNTVTPQLELNQTPTGFPNQNRDLLLYKRENTRSEFTQQMDSDEDEYDEEEIDVEHSLSSSPMLNNESSYMRRNRLETFEFSPSELMRIPDRMPNSMANTTSGTKAKRIRIHYTATQLAVLEHYYKQNPNACGNSKTKLEICLQLNLTPQRVKIWFQNRRRKDRLKEMNES